MSFIVISDELKCAEKRKTFQKRNQGDKEQKVDQ